MPGFDRIHDDGRTCWHVKRGTRRPIVSFNQLEKKYQKEHDWADEGDSFVVFRGWAHALEEFERRDNLPFGFQALAPASFSGGHLLRLVVDEWGHHDGEVVIAPFYVTSTNKGLDK